MRERGELAFLGTTHDSRSLRRCRGSDSSSLSHKHTHTLTHTRSRLDEISHKHYYLAFFALSRVSSFLSLSLSGPGADSYVLLCFAFSSLDASCLDIYAYLFHIATRLRLLQKSLSPCFSLSLSLSRLSLRHLSLIPSLSTPTHTCRHPSLH